MPGPPPRRPSARCQGRGAGALAKAGWRRWAPGRRAGPHQALAQVRGRQPARPGVLTGAGEAGARASRTPAGAPHPGRGQAPGGGRGEDLRGQGGWAPGAGSG